VETVATDGPDPTRVVFDTADDAAATTIAVPQRLATRRNWRASLASSQVAVLIAPPRAA